MMKKVGMFVGLLVLSAVFSGKGFGAEVVAESSYEFKANSFQGMGSEEDGLFITAVVFGVSSTVRLQGSAGAIACVATAKELMMASATQPQQQTFGQAPPLSRMSLLIRTKPICAEPGSNGECARYSDYHKLTYCRVGRLSSGVSTNR